MSYSTVQKRGFPKLGEYQRAYHVVREADLLLHIIDISHPDFEDHIASVNQTLLDIKANNKPTLMVFNKIDAYQHLTIDEDDLITERTRKHYTLEEWKRTWMHDVGEKNALFISATQKENFEEFREESFDENFSVRTKLKISGS
jgi:GTP-binding protein HflX